MDLALEIKEISKNFGGVEALRNVIFDVRPRTIHSLIGPNGAGKSTLLNIISGVHPPTSGEVKLYGRRITGLPTHKIARLGVARTYQLLELPQNLLVKENILVGAVAKNGFWVRKSELLSQVHGISEFLGLKDRLDEPTQNLPLGEQRLVEIARALATGPSLLLLDEPAAGLNTRESKRLGELLRVLVSEKGLTILLVEHDMDLVMGISDVITVLNFGEVILTGTPDEIYRDQRVHAAYFGEED